MYTKYNKVNKIFQSGKFRKQNKTKKIKYQLIFY